MSLSLMSSKGQCSLSFSIKSIPLGDGPEGILWKPWGSDCPRGSDMVTQRTQRLLLTPQSFLKLPRLSPLQQALSNQESGSPFAAALPQNTSVSPAVHGWMGQAGHLLTPGVGDRPFFQDLPEAIEMWASPLHPGRLPRTLVAIGQQRCCPVCL